MHLTFLTQGQTSSNSISIKTFPWWNGLLKQEVNIRGVSPRVTLGQPGRSFQLYLELIIRIPVTLEGSVVVRVDPEVRCPY